MFHEMLLSKDTGRHTQRLSVCVAKYKKLTLCTLKSSINLYIYIYIYSICTFVYHRVYTIHSRHFSSVTFALSGGATGLCYG
ncbi:hypothetical protein AB4K20DRAFT_1963105 [Rhizopus microsporus]